MAGRGSPSGLSSQRHKRCERFLPHLQHPRRTTSAPFFLLCADVAGTSPV